MISPQTLARAALFAALALAPAAQAAGKAAPEIAGRWVITKAAIAPWSDPQQAGGPQEERRLVGKSVTFSARSISGPSPLGCKHPVYTVRDDPPDMLFEGGLGGPDRAGKPRNAVALARALGMTTNTVRTVEIGCSEISLHRFAPDTLVFGLNNRIYSMRRVSKGKS